MGPGTRGLAERSGLRRSWILWLACAGMLFAAATGALAQQITGTIAGTVADSQGAVVPSAAVKATNAETGFSRSTVSDSAGNYTLSYLPVGNYTVEVTAPGFKKFLQQNLTVNVDTTQGFNASLTVGAVDETITVTTAPPTVNITSETLGRTIGSEEINNLPLVNRNAYSELSLTPGVQTNSASSQSNASGTPNFVIGVPSTQVIVNGGVDGGVPMVGFYLDGGINMTGLRNYGNAVPNPDALEEFRVETANFGAAYGRYSGAVVTVVTKSGTNKFHGSLYEFVRNNAFNATPWGQLTKPAYHRNQYGGTVGGPIKRDKAFFYFSYGGLRMITPNGLSGGVLPTALERAGDFTKSATIPNFPGTKTPISGTNSSSNCATVTVGCVPTSLLDKTAANIISKYVPLPNLAGNLYSGSVNVPTNEDEYLGKFDWVASEKDHIQGSYFTIKTTQGAYGGGNIPYMTNNSIARQQNVNLSDVHTFNGTKANQVWLTFTRVAGGRVNTPDISIGDLGSSFTIQGPKALPQLSISGYFGAGGSLAGPVSNTDFYGLRDVYTFALGHHQINAGGEFSLEKDAVQGNLYNFGVFNFATSAPTSTGNALADFVTGQVNTMEQDTPYHSLHSFFYGAGFVQDAWKVNPRLTANLSLRYDVQQSPVESQNLTTAFVAGQQSTVVPSAPKGVLFPGDQGIPRGVSATKWGHVSPRVGLVLDPFGNGKTAVRAGAGIFYGSVSLNEWNQPANAQPFAIRQTFNSITSLTNVYGNPASFPNGDPFPYTFNPSSPRFLPAAAVESIDPNYKWPQSYQVNAAVEQQLAGHTSLQVAYVGNFVRHVPFGIDGNAPIYATGASTSQTSINARRPYDPGVLGDLTLITSGQTANYNSLQVSFHKQMSRGLLLNGFYVWSHSVWSANASAIGQGSAQDFGQLSEERGPSDNDRRNVGNISAVWTIDYYHGGNFALTQLANGWKVSGVASFQSGAPFSVSTGSDKNLDGYNADRPNLTGQPWRLDPHRPRAQVAAAWFNTAAFTANGPGLGIGPGGADGTTPRDFLVGPGYRDVDMAAERDFKFLERFNLQIRGEATNVFNLVSLSNPGTTCSPNSAGTCTSTTFGKITSAATPRLIQVGARLTF